MKTLEALYFPGTQIYSASQFPVLLLMDTIHLLQPVEADETTDNSADIFISAGRCQAHTPSPLGENRDRFLHLIRDIRERKDDYAAQLSSLTVASLSARKPSIDDSSRGIIASLLDGHNVSTPLKDEEDVQLWQARLVLKIGEILDREEEEVAMQIALLDDEEEGLFKELQGEMAEEEESLFSELQQLNKKISRPTTSTIKNRLSAWSRLLRAGDAPQPALWLTHMPEAADILLEKYNNQYGEDTRPVAVLPLPANIGWSKADALQVIEEFREDAGKICSSIGSALQTLQPDSLKRITSDWTKAIDEFFPSHSNGRTDLVIYHFPKSSCSQLVGDTSRPDSGTLLAVVQMR